MNKKTIIMVMAGVTVVAVAVLVWLGYSKNSAIHEELMPQRDKAFKQIETLGSKRRPVNKEINVVNRQRVDDLLASLDKVRSSNFEFNSKNYKVPQLKIIDGQPRPALPYDAKIWKEKGLAYQYVMYYRKSVDGMLKKLSVTDVPSQRMINEQAALQEERLEYKARIENKEAAAGGVQQPAGGGMMPAMPGRSRARGGAAKDVSSQAMEIGLNNAIIGAAEKGWIYANKNSMFPMFPGTMYSELPAEDVWQAQLSIWVQGDITNAIYGTIKEIFDNKALPEKERNVLNSPIKRLVSITMEEKTSTATAAGAPGGMMGPMMMPDMGGRRGRKKQKQKTERFDPNAKVTPAASLSENTSNRLFDVVNYKFVVIMPTRYLPLLQKKLMEQNYHVIMNQMVESPDASTGQRMGGLGRGANVTSDELFYYGSEAVRKVTIEAQLLLLTPFSRGEWNDETEKWLHLPMMPLEIMKKLEKAALRREDFDLLAQYDLYEKKEPLDDKLPSMPWTKSDWTAAADKQE